MTATERAAAGAVAIAGALLLVLLGAWGVPEFNMPWFGDQVYDYYALALLDGRLDVPPRIVTLEGHYAADGTAYVYHGLLPVLTRLPAAPFVDLRETSLALPTIVLFAIVGTALYQLGMLAWLTAPGLLLVANGSLFHEPIAAAYVLCASFLALLLGTGKRPGPGRLVVLAILAGLCVHARPHLAAGLYVVVGVLVLAHLFRPHGEREVGRSRGQSGGGAWRWTPPVAALLVLAAFGASYLGLNALRFADPLRTHGGTEDRAIDYGSVYWGIEAEDSPRNRALEEHGRFNAARVAPNAFLYLVGLPVHLGAGAWAEARYRAWTRELGWIRIEAPVLGILFLWAPWFGIIVLGLVPGFPLEKPGLHRRRPRLPAMAALAGTGMGAALLLAYATHAFRYRFDLWPLVAVGVILALPVVGRRIGVAGRPRRLTIGALVVLSTIGVAATLTIRRPVAEALTQGGPFSTWSQTICERMAGKRGFDGATTRRLCSLP